MKKERKPHLGRGLESLLGPITRSPQVEEPQPAGPVVPAMPAETVVTAAEAMGTEPAPEAQEVESEMQGPITELAVGEITANPFQPRSVWNEDELLELAASIKANGIIQPILVRKLDSGFQIIAGERRFRAAKLADLEKVPVIVREATDEQMLELALVENIHRSDLNPVERALAYQNYITTFNITQTEAAERMGEDRSVISNHIRLLDLPQEVKQMLIDGQLSMGHARAILSLPTDDLRRKLANRAMAGRLSVREVERLVRLTLEGSQSDRSRPVPQKPANIVDLEKQLRSSLGTKVQIQPQKKGGSGRIIIDYYSLDEFDRLTQIMGMATADLS